MKPGVIARLRQMFAKSEAKRKQKAHRVLVDWQTSYKDLQAHPLTQAKVLNEQLMKSTGDQLKRMNEKIDGIHDRVTHLEKKSQKMPVNIKRTKKVSRRVKRTPRPVPKPSKPRLSKAEILRKLLSSPNLSEQEKKIVQFIGDKRESEATAIAKRFKISRSNASLKLNKMHNFNCLTKRLEGKTVYYRLKDTI